MKRTAILISICRLAVQGLLPLPANRAGLFDNLLGRRDERFEILRCLVFLTSHELRPSSLL